MEEKIKQTHRKYLLQEQLKIIKKVRMDGRRNGEMEGGGADPRTETAALLRICSSRSEDQLCEPEPIKTKNFVAVLRSWVWKKKTKKLSRRNSERDSKTGLSLST